MVMWFWIMGIVLVAIVTALLLMLVVRMAQRSRQSPADRAVVERLIRAVEDLPADQPAIDWEAISNDRLQRLLKRHKRIEAIAVYHELTRAGFEQAKAAIDYALAHPDEAGQKKKKAAYDSQDAGIRDLVEEGRMDEAVEIYKRFAGVDEYTARDAVAAIEHELKAKR